MARRHLDAVGFLKYNITYIEYSYLTNRLHFPVRVYCNRSQKTSQRVKNKEYDKRRSRLLFFTRCDVFCDLLQYSRSEKCNLFVLYNKNLNGLLKDFGGMKKEKQKEKQVCGRDLTWI